MSVDGKTFFDIPVKDKEEACEKIIEMSKNNDYAKRSLLDYELIPGYYKLIATDLSKQEKLENQIFHMKLIAFVRLLVKVE